MLRSSRAQPSRSRAEARNAAGAHGLSQCGTPSPKTEMSEERKSPYNCSCGSGSTVLSPRNGQGARTYGTLCGKPTRHVLKTWAAGAENLALPVKGELTRLLSHPPPSSQSVAHQAPADFVRRTHLFNRLLLRPACHAAMPGVASTADSKTLLELPPCCCWPGNHRGDTPSAQCSSSTGCLQ